MTEAAAHRVADAVKELACAATFDSPLELPVELGQATLRVEVARFPVDRVPPHHHDCGQLIYSGIQAVSVKTLEGYWVVPPSSALWMPVGVAHQVACRSERQMASVYVRQDVARKLWDRACAITVSGLLRELIRHAGRDEFSQTDRHRQVAVADIILDEMACSKTHLIAPSLPADKRARAAAELFLSAPAKHQSTAELGRAVGASERTLQRLFLRETGLSVRDWISMVRLQKALELLDAGMTIKAVSHELGYEDPGSLVRLFNRILGVTPSKWRSA